MANTNIYAVPLFVISYCRPNVLKRQNGQEMQSQLVRYWWSVTQTKTASLGKGWSRQFISLPNTSVIMMDFKVKEGAENMLTPSTVGSSILTKSPIRKKSIFHWRTQFKIKQVKPQNMLLSYFPHFHSFSSSCDIGKVFMKWLTGSGGGCKKDRTAQQIVTRCFCCEDEEELTFDEVDFSWCSPNLLFKFNNYLQEECKLGHGGQLGYVDAISEMIDFRKLHGASEAILRNFSATELYLKRAWKTVANMMRLQWT